MSAAIGSFEKSEPVRHARVRLPWPNLGRDGSGKQAPIGRSFVAMRVRFSSALPADHFSCVVTSPPYFWQRDYDVAGQIGLRTINRRVCAVGLRHDGRGQTGSQPSRAFSSLILATRTTQPKANPRATIQNTMVVVSRCFGPWTLADSACPKRR